MKKLSLLFLPLLTISFLSNCGGGLTPTEDVKFSVQESSVTLKEDNTIKIHLDWNPSGDIIEFSNFTFTLDSGSTTAEVTPGLVGDRPLELTIAFTSKLSSNDTGDLKFHYNDKTTKKEGEGKVTDINIKLPVDPPTPSKFALEVNCTFCTPLGNKSEYEEGEDVSFSITPDTDYVLPEKKDVDVDGVITFEYTIGSGVATFSCTMPSNKVTVTITATPKPGPTTYTLSATCTNGTVSGNLGQYEANSNVALTFNPNQDHFLPASLDGFDELTGIDKSKITYSCTTGSLTFKMPANEVTIKAIATIPETKGMVIWRNYNDTNLIDPYEFPVGYIAEYTGSTPTHPADDSYVYQFSGWDPNPTATPVVEGDNVFKAQYDKVAITNLAAGIKLVIPSGNADLTFSFNCTATKKITVDWGDLTVDSNKSHTYTTSGTYNVKIYGEDITTVSAGGKGKNYISEIDLKDKITAIPKRAFDYCPVTNIHIPDSVTSIGEYAFSDCLNLTSIPLSDNIDSIGRGAFYCCFRLTSITIPKKLTSIGDEVFMGCTSLTSIAIPNNILSIGQNAFQNCLALETVDLTDFIVKHPLKIPSLGSHAFENCDKYLVFKVIDDDMLSMFREKSGWEPYADKIHVA